MPPLRYTISVPVSIPQFDLTRQYSALESEILEQIKQFLPKQSLILGPTVEALESHLKDYLQTQEAITISSGTDALLVALMELEVAPGDEVIVPAFTFYATASVVSRLGAKPVFVDILPDTFNIDPEAIRAAITPKTKALIPVHLFGQSCDLDAILALATQYDIPVIEDTAQAFGSRWNNQALGTFGTFGAYSFYPTKNLGTFGEGGLITTSSEKRARMIRALRVHGSEKRYIHFLLGGNFRLAALQALVLDIKLKYVDQWIEKRRKNAQYYFDHLKNIGDLVLPATHPKAFHSYNQFVIRTQQRDALRTHLQESGIGTDIYYPSPLPLQPAFAYLNYQEGNFPESDRAAKEVLALPIFPELKEEELAAIVAAIKKFY